MIVIIPPDKEPVTLEEVKAHLKVLHNDEDGYINSLITGARIWCENYQTRKYVEQVIELAFDTFPAGIMKLYPSPALEIIRITGEDKNGKISEITNFTFCQENIGRLVFNSLPALQLKKIGGVKIRYKAGYGKPEQVPEPVKLAIKLIVGHFYENREDTTEIALKKIPFGSLSLLAHERIDTFGASY